MLSKKQTPSPTDWDKRVAAGSQKVPVALGSRTTTVDDPLTTSLLAEVARRSRTVEVSPDQIDEATEVEPGRDPKDDPI